jgi:hypothetical protein
MDLAPAPWGLAVTLAAILILTPIQVTKRSIREGSVFLPLFSGRERNSSAIRRGLVLFASAEGRDNAN